MTITATPPLRRFRCSTERLGRHHGTLTFWISAVDADDLAKQLHEACRRHLLSRDFEVEVDLSTGKAWIGWGRMGTFTITEIGAAK